MRVLNRKARVVERCRVDWLVWSIMHHRHSAAVVDAVQHPAQASCVPEFQARPRIVNSSFEQHLQAPGGVGLA